MTHPVDSRIKAIAAMSLNRVIGNEGGLPWHLPSDMKHVSKLTKGHWLVMGSSTYESLPAQYKPLPGRHSIVLSRRTREYNHELVHGASSVDAALELFRTHADDNQILWVFGGSQIYTTMLPLCAELHLTVVSQESEGDTFFPPHEHLFECVEETPGEGLVWQRHVRCHIHSNN